jgi:hypothetical protein
MPYLLLETGQFHYTFLLLAPKLVFGPTINGIEVPDAPVGM